MRVTDKELDEAIEKSDRPFVVDLCRDLREARQALSEARGAAIGEAIAVADKVYRMALDDDNDAHKWGPSMILGKLRALLASLP